MATSDRGFASMDEQKQREIAAKGGSSVPGDERSFSKDRELAAQAGRKGGEHSHGGQQQQASGSSRQQQASGSSRQQQGGGGSGNFANDRQRASEAGHKGGQS